MPNHAWEIIILWARSGASLQTAVQVKTEIESLRNDIQMNLNRGREVNTRIRAESTRIRRAKTFSHKAARDNQYFSASDSAIALLGRRRRFAVVDCSKAKRN